jgi:hypothetical protein
VIESARSRPRAASKLLKLCALRAGFALGGRLAPPQTVERGLSESSVWRGVDVRFALRMGGWLRDLVVHRNCLGGCWHMVPDCDSGIGAISRLVW